MIDGFKKHLLGGTWLGGFKTGPHTESQPNPTTYPKPTVTSSKLAGAPLRSTERGLIVSPPITIAGTGVSVSRNELDPQELRFALLFWDRLDYPSNNFADFRDPDNPEYQFLLKAGVLTASHIVMSSGTAEDVVHGAFVGAYRELNKRDPEKWSLARGEKSLGFSPGELLPNRGILLELHRAIPVPDRDIPLEDILQFKAKRKAELLNLRHHLEKVYLDITNSQERDFAKTLALSELDQAIVDVFKVGRESRMRLKLFGLEAKLDVVDVVPGAVSAALALSAGLSLTEAFLAGVAGSVAPKLSIKSGVGLKGHKPTATPFEYVSKYHRDLF